jgi:flavin reductase (DIM6/NTAB) family NADH-FMN oxidoreductase RutF
MAKISKGPQHWIAPMPALLIGSVVDGSPNFMTVAWAGIANGEPPMVAAAIRPARHTLKGIRAHQEFSVNVPSKSQFREADFCGVKSGASVNNKAERCGFTVYSGTLKHAPLIEQCPINLECSVSQVIELNSHCLVLGKIVEVHVTDDCLSDDGNIDFLKVDPLVFLDNPTRKYCGIGEIVGEAFSAGLGI